MRPEGVAAAIREAKRAQRTLPRISFAHNADELEDAWADFLSHANRVYTKLRAACYGHPRDFGWYGKKLDTRDRDPLLLYIHKARNSDTHRLEQITEDRKPLPVTDEYGKIFPVPTHHLGRPIASELFDVDIDRIARLGSRYLVALVSEAESRLR